MKTRSQILIVSFIVGISILSIIVIQNPPKNSIDIDVFYPEQKPEIGTHQVKNCNLLGYADVNCFINSFNACTPAVIEDTHGTVEGDPITTVATIRLNANQTSCAIDLQYDSTQDRFANPGIAKYTCFGIKLDDNYLYFNNCTDETKDGNDYGFEISRRH